MFQFKVNDTVKTQHGTIRCVAHVYPNGWLLFEAHKDDSVCQRVGRAEYTEVWNSYDVLLPVAPDVNIGDMALWFIQSNTIAPVIIKGIGQTGHFIVTYTGTSHFLVPFCEIKPIVLDPIMRRFA